MEVDNRLIGETSENIFLSLLNERGVFAHVFDTAGFDGIAFDLKNRYFKIGKAPFFVQIKCRGAKSDRYSTQGHSPDVFEHILKIARELKIPRSSLYLVLGFFKNNDIRQIRFYIIPFSSLLRFKGKGTYRFSVAKCEAACNVDPRIISI
jgi:hypothetical protein